MSYSHLLDVTFISLLKFLKSMMKSLAFLLFSLSLICFTINGQNLKDNEGKRTGKWIIYKSKSSKDLKIEEGVFVKGRKEGQWIKYFEDGKTPKLKGSYSNNRPDGEFIRYYKNGKIKEFIEEKCNTKRKKICEIDEVTLNASHRNRKEICNFSSKLYPNFNATEPCNSCDPLCHLLNQHIGIFVVRFLGKV